jgi:hypothetical protein
MIRNPGETLFLIAVLMTIAGLCFLLTPPGLSSNEEAVQYVQMKNFALHGSLEIQSPAFGLGFEASDLAGPRGNFVFRDGRLYAAPPPFFPWVASLFYPLFGERSVDFAPILFLLLSALILGLILDRLMERDYLYWLLLGAYLVGSPVFLQGLLFSGMTLALLLIVSSLWLMVSHFGNKPSMAKLFGASILLAISVFTRPECIVIALSFYLGAAIVLAAQKRRKDLLGVLTACAVSACVFVLHDVALHGRFPGPYLEMLLPFYTLSPIRIAALGGSLLVSLGLIVLSRREGTGPLWKAIPSILSVILVIGAVLLTAARITVSHLMAFFPAVLFVFYGVPGRLERLKKGEGALEAILAATVVFCLVLGAAILRPGSWIVFSVWLPVVPFVILLIALERKVIFAARGMYIVLAFFCGVAFVNGIQESKDRFLKYKDYNAARIAFLEKHTSADDAIVFGDAGSMEHAGPLFFDRVFLVAKSPGDQERFSRRLAERGIEKVYAWTTNPLSIKGFNPYGGESPPVFAIPQALQSCCSGSCRERNHYLVRLDTGTFQPAGDGRGGS